MEQGNPNKVNAIVDEIVKNNSIFKQKSPIEQDREKDSMARCINNALSVLNEVGKELVLKDLSVDPDEKFKGFIDNTGKIDISGMAKFTSIIVKEKIEEAERKGIDLRKDASQILENTSTKLENGILTIAALDMMIKNYEDLSTKDRMIITENWENLTNSQRSEVSRKKSEMLLRRAKEAKTDQERQVFLDLHESEENNAAIYSQLENASDEVIQVFENQYLKEFGEEFVEFCRKYPNSNMRDIVSRYKAQRDKEYEIIADYCIDNPVREGDIDNARRYKERTMREQIIMSPQILSQIGGLEYWNSLSLEEQTKIAVSYLKESISTYIAPTEDVITQVPSILNQLEFKEKQTQSVLAIYMETLRSLETDDIENYKKYILEERRDEIHEEIKGFFIEDGISPEDAEKLSKIDYNGQLFEILGDSAKREEFFEQLEKLIEQTQDIDKTQTDSQPLPEDVSAELNAIPVALQRINCPQEDIAKGMEAYKQVIGALTPEEIEGTPDIISELLQKAVEEFGLDGVAGDILKMMSQITFNGQISEILKTCKDAFLASLETLDLNGPLLDPRVYAVNPEQYAESSVASTLTERIGEDSLKTGFAALAVDLQVAEQTIIRPEELVADGVEQRKDDQVEVTETTEHEEKKDSTENSVIKKLQTFFGMYHSSRTSDSDLEEEISDLELATQKMIEDMQMQATQNGQAVQQGNKPPVQPVKDEDDFQQE